MQRFFRRHRRATIVVAGLVLVGALAAGGGYLYLQGRTGNVFNPNVEFHNERPPRVVSPESSRFVWPFYGYGADRRRFLDVPLRPPFRVAWHISGRALLEFPPVLAHNTLYDLNDRGSLFAVDALTGRQKWRRHIGSLAAASPAVQGSRVYAVVLQRSHTIHAGRVIAVNATSGHLVWSRPLRARAESPPVIAGGLLYFGSEDGTVYALRTRDGSIRWTYRASGAVKGGPALSGGVLYFGDYGGHVQAVRASDGHKVWSAKTQGAHFGFSSGQFYSTAAVAFGRVYLGSTDGFVYSFGASDGKLAWSRQTGNYVYGSPAVASVPGLGPTVYIGSYDGKFYALNAHTGKVSWTYNAGGRISGAATIVGDTVYFANLAKRTTIGLGVRGGSRQFFFPHGGFNPVIADGHAIYLTGYSTLYRLQKPQRAAPRRHTTHPSHKRKHKRRKARHKRKRHRFHHRQKRHKQVPHLAHPAKHRLIERHG